MSGICIAGGTEDASQRVKAMLARMSLYGQKQGCVTIGRDLAAGRAFHGRLASEHAPLTENDGITVLVDGEIFGEDGPLENPAARISSLYRNDDLDQIAWLNGSFAAVILDAKAERVVLASDRIGSRPLFVWENGKRFAVASRLNALLTDDRVPTRLSRQGVIEVLTLQRTTGHQTQYADIRATTAAELWTFGSNGAGRRRSRRLAWTQADFDEREGARQLASALKLAVVRRTSDNARHGLLLSGGLDARVVLAAASDKRGAPSCLTAGPFRNKEVALAEACAQSADAKFTYFDSPPATLAARLDAATAASDGLFTAPVNLFGLLPAMAREHDVLLSGHGLDYTLRGYYLPCRMARIAGSTTRLPWLRKIQDGRPETLVRNLRVGIGTDEASTVLRPEIAAEVMPRKVTAVGRALEAAEIENPYNAWDAYVLSCLGRHYAWSDFVAMESVVAHRAITFDPAVFDLYLAMPPEWRASGRMAQKAMVMLGPELMNLPDANTGVRARLPFAAQIALVFANAALRRVGAMPRPVLPDPTTSHGSWANFPELLRRDPGFRARLSDLPGDPALMDTGLFDRAGVANILEAHQTRRASHTKLLLQLLTISSWLNQNSFTGVTDDC